MPDSAVKFTTLRKYIKQRTDLRVEQAVVDFLLAKMNTAIERVTDRAAELARGADRVTIQLRDMEAAFEEVGGTSPTTLPAAAISEMLDAYSVDQLGELVRAIERSLED